jgi:ApaG protein
MGGKSFYYAMTDGIRVTVRPQYVPARYRPEVHEYVFVYRVRIENAGAGTVKLTRRRWLVRDATGEEQHVEGDGVVGRQPTLHPGTVHEYKSYCVLPTPSGWMEGEYILVDKAGTERSARIPRFDLTAEDSPSPS